MAGRSRVPAGLLMLAALALPAVAAAQVSGNASLMTDYRYRGFSLSDQRPAVTATVAYDHPSGAYLEVTAIAAARGGELRTLGYQAYVGYARRLESGSSWDVGIAQTDVTEYFHPRYRASYAEAYVGVASRNLSAHVYYAPNYLGEGVETLYGSLDGAVSPRANWRLFAHSGVLTPIHKSGGSEIHGAQYDQRLGVSRQFGPTELRLSWTSFSPGADYPAGHRQSRDALVLSAAYSF